MSCPACETTISKKVINDTKKERFVRSKCSVPETNFKYNSNSNSRLDFWLNGNCNSSKNELTRNIYESATLSNDLASGDHEKCVKKSRSEHKTKCKSFADKTGSQLQAGDQARCLKTIYEYKNKNYCDSESESIGMMRCQSLPKLKGIYEENGSGTTFPRPIICPVLDCGKVIAVDSVLLHFYFDHSKVPRITLSMKNAEQIVLKPSLVSQNAVCLAVFLPQDKEYKETNSDHKDYNLLLLMATRVQSKQPKYANRKQNPKTTLLLNVATQTDNFTQQFSRHHVSYSSLKESAFSSTNEKTISASNEFDKDELLLVWLCKLEFGALQYSVTLLRGDKKQAHSYIGETVNIRDKQDSAAMMERADCLILQGAAVNRLIDDDGNIIILVNVLNCFKSIINT